MKKTENEMRAIIVTLPATHPLIVSAQKKADKTTGDVIEAALYIAQNRQDAMRTMGLGWIIES